MEYVASDVGGEGNKGRRIERGGERERGIN